MENDWLLYRYLRIALVAIIFLFSSLQPALAIPPPFPTTNWLHQEVSSVLGTSWQLPGSDADQTENSQTTIKPKGSTAEFQFVPAGTTSSSGLTDGYGWIFDSPLGGQYDAGTWTFYVRLRLAGGGAPTGTVRAYVKRYDGASTYTNLFTASVSNVTPSSSATTINFQISPGTVDMQGQYLYVHYSWQSDPGSTGNNPTTVAFHVEGTDIAAADRARIVPPGSSIDALGYSLIAISIVFFVAVLVKKRILYVKKVQVT